MSATKMQSSVESQSLPLPLSAVPASPLMTQLQERADKDTKLSAAWRAVEAALRELEKVEGKRLSQKEQAALLRARDCLKAAGEVVRRVGPEWLNMPPPELREEEEEPAAERVRLRCEGTQGGKRCTRDTKADGSHHSGGHQFERDQEDDGPQCGAANPANAAEWCEEPEGHEGSHGTAGDGDKRNWWPQSAKADAATGPENPATAPKHTPGPWSVEAPAFLSGRGVLHIVSTDADVCELEAQSEADRGRVAADAVLIAAAPDMAKVLANQLALLIKLRGDGYSVSDSELALAVTDVARVLKAAGVSA